ncbi:MAG: endonuclease/exonuclease/phosphatase family protein [Salinivirgaceae bacterium]|nr:endonuclease/exonuclease/phosphatase family protein [Salinivirgaceae bacterium]
MFRKILRHIILIINIGFVVLMLVSGLARYFNPAKYTLIAITGLGFPILLIINVFFAAGWLIARKLYCFISLVPILLFMFRHIDFGSGGRHTPSTEKFRVMTYNSHGIGYSYWPKHKKTMEEMVDFIHSRSADIVCIQEFASGKNDMPAERLLQKEYGYAHVALAAPNWMRGDIKNGIATFSRFPIVAKHNIESSKEGNTFLLTDVLIGTDTVRIINCHLQSNRFSEGEYEFIEDMNSFNAGVYKKTEMDQKLEGVRSVLARMRKAYKWRVKQTEKLTKLIEESPYSTFLCGDFNDTPSSYVYRKVSRRMRDSHRIADFGWHNTYRRFWPGLRIDYVMYNGAIQCCDHNVPAYDVSDHRPVEAEFFIAKPKN